MIFKQFYNSEFPQYNYLYVVNSGNDMSRYLDGPNLFGWGPKRYTNSFHLEIVYG